MQAWVPPLAFMALCGSRRRTTLPMRRAAPTRCWWSFTVAIKASSGRWIPGTRLIGDDLIIAYVQSSLRADTKSYRWDLGGVDIYHLPTAQDEVLGLYQAIVREYAVDTDRVALAGFSQGGGGRWIEPVRIRTADAR